MSNDWISAISGPVSGLVVALLGIKWFSKNVETKDQLLVAAFQATITQSQEETRACNERYLKVLDRVFALEDKKADKA